MAIRQDGPRVFQIGFNRCATGALFKLFDNSGVRSLHHMGRKHRKAGDLVLLDENPQKRIDKNLRRGRPPVEGYEEFTGFFDMEYSDRKVRIENYRYFVQFDEAYPDALFIMNYRDKDGWLKSRIAHNNGKFLQKNCERMGLSAEEVVAVWAAHYDQHLAEVRAYFGEDHPRCIWYKIDAEPIDKVLNFFKPHYLLERRRWKMAHSTDWDTVYGSYAEAVFAAHQARFADQGQDRSAE